jgi:hypothetical protein
MSSADKEFISSVNDKTNETVLETLRRVKDNIGEKFKSLIKTVEEEKPRVTNKTTSDEQPRNPPATNKAKRTLPFNEKPQYRHSLKPSINFELPTDSYSEIQLKSLSKNLLRYFGIYFSFSFYNAL